MTEAFKEPIEHDFGDLLTRRSKSRNPLHQDQEEIGLFPLRMNPELRHDNHFARQQNPIGTFDHGAHLDTQSSHGAQSSHHDLGPPVVFVSHGCLLLPVAFMLWYYWSKRFARTIVRGLLTAAPSSSAGDDRFTGTERHSNSDNQHRDSFDLPPPMGCDEEFSSWDDVMEHNLRDSSLRYVRWYKANNNSQTKSWPRLSVTAFWSRLRGRPSPRSSATSAKSWLSPMLSREEEEFETIEVLSPTSGDSNIQWHCLNDLTGIELSLASPTCYSGDEEDGSPSLVCMELR